MQIATAETDTREDTAARATARARGEGTRPATAQTFESRFLTLAGRQSPQVREQQIANKYLATIAKTGQEQRRLLDRVERNTQSGATLTAANLQ